jgi:predicted permease
MRELVRELGQALRVLSHEARFSASAVLTLTVAVGVTTAMFSVLYGVLLRPLPYPEAGRVVRVWEEHTGGTPLVTEQLNALTWRDWTDGRTVERFAAYRDRGFVVSGLDQPERVAGAELSATVFPVLRVAPFLGRFFDERDTATGAACVVVLSHTLWEQSFDSRREVIGTSVRLNGRPHQIIGVAPERFYFPDREARLWTPFLVATATDPDPSQTLVASVIARLRPGTTLSQVEAEGTVIAQRSPRPLSAELMFGKGSGRRVRARFLIESATHRVRPALFAVSGAVTLVFLLACANVANLLLARGLSRTRELAVRAALGAGRARLLRFALAESLLLALAGGSFGAVLGWILTRAVHAFAPREFPRLDDIRLDGHVLVFALLVVACAGLLAGILPAINASRARAGDVLRRAGGLTTSGGTERVRTVLLGLQAALSVVLLVSAALLGRSFVALLQVDAGYEPRNLLAARIHVPATSEPSDANADFIRTLMERLPSVPGVIAAGAGNMAPLGDSSYLVAFQLPSGTMAQALHQVVTPGYAAALGLRVREGRFLERSDGSAGVQYTVVNQAFVRAYLNDGHPVVGRQFKGLLSTEDTVTEIVGVVDDVLLDGYDAPQRPEPQMYVALGNAGGIRREIYLFVRTAGAPDDFVPVIRSLIREIQPEAALARAGAFSVQVAHSIAQPRFATAMMTIIAGVALLLAVSGIYAITAYSVSRRRREISIRAALGATPFALTAMIVSRGLRVTIAGLTAGLFVAALAARGLRPLLFGVSSVDPLSFTLTPVILLLVAAAACILPARRASRVEVSEALRSD